MKYFIAAALASLTNAFCSTECYTNCIDTTESNSLYTCFTEECQCSSWVAIELEDMTTSIGNRLSSSGNSNSNCDIDAFFNTCLTDFMSDYDTESYKKCAQSTKCMKFYNQLGSMAG